MEDFQQGEDLGIKEFEARLQQVNRNRNHSKVANK